MKKVQQQLHAIIANLFHRFRGVGDLPFIQKGSFRSELLPSKVRHRRDVLFSFEDFLGILRVHLATLHFKIRVYYTSVSDSLQCHSAERPPCSGASAAGKSRTLSTSQPRKFARDCSAAEFDSCLGTFDLGYA